MSYLASLSSFELQPLNIMPFSRHHHPLSPQQMTIPTNTVCHSQLIYGFTPTQHEHQICRSFSVFELYSTHCCYHGSQFFVRFKSRFLSGKCFTSMQYCWPYLILGFRGNLLPCSNSPHSLGLVHQHLFLAVAANSHPPPALTLSPAYVISFTVSTSHRLSS